MSIQSNGNLINSYRQQQHQSNEFNLKNFKINSATTRKNSPIDLNTSSTNVKRKSALLTTTNNNNNNKTMQSGTAKPAPTTKTSHNYDLINSQSPSSSFTSNSNNISKFKHYFQKHLNTEYNSTQRSYVNEKNLREREQQDQKKDADYYDALTAARPRLSSKSKSNSLIKIKTTTAG